MNDYRSYKGIDYSTAFLVHYGVSKRNGAKIGSGRYEVGSGERPDQWKERGRAKSEYKAAKERYKVALKDYRSHSKTAKDMNDTTKTTAKALASKERQVEKLKSKMNESKDVLKSAKKAEREEAYNRFVQAYEERAKARKEKLAAKKAEQEEKRAAKEAEKEEQREIKKAEAADKKLLEKVHNGKVNINKMSNEELNTSIDRIRKEDTLRTLMGKKTLEQSVKDSPNAIMADTGKQLVKEGLSSLVKQVIVPTATGYILYGMAQSNVDKRNVEIEKWNKANPNNPKRLEKDVDFVGTVFTKAKRQ